MNSFHRFAFGLLGAVVLTFGVIFIYHHFGDIKPGKKARKTATKQSKSLKGSTSPSFNAHSSSDQSNGSISSAELQHLVSLLPAANTTKFFKIMRTLIQISNDNINIPSFRSPIILDDLFSQLTLGGDGEFLRSVNVHILNIFTNIVVDDAIRAFLKAKFDRLFDAKLASLNDNELSALFRLLGNFAMMSDSADAVVKHFSELLDFVTCEIVLVRRLAWTVLLNLSCDPESVNVMLKSKVANDAEENLMNALQEKDEIILSKSLKFLSNVYKCLQYQEGRHLPPGSLSKFLLNVRDGLHLQTTLLLPQTISMEGVYEDAQRLAQILEASH